MSLAVMEEDSGPVLVIWTDREKDSLVLNGWNIWNIYFPLTFFSCP